MIPCARPKVTIIQDGPDGQLLVRCRVPGCGFETHHAVKAGADEEARWHRQAHRAAAPRVDVVLVDGFRWVECECGVRRRHGTLSDAQAWRSYHLGHDHGAVTC